MVKFNFDHTKPLIVAEIGNNHEGNFDLAKQMVMLAKESGADAVKFQTFIPELFINSKDKARFDRLKSFQLSFAQFEELASLSESLGLIFFSTPLDLESALFLNDIQPIFKIASGDNDFYPLMDLVASFKKPTIISTGMIDLESIKDINQRFSEQWENDISLDQLAFLHCVTSYPVPHEQANLAAINTLKHAFPENTIGYSDHTIGTEACVYSAILGASVIEKHFTIDNNYSSFRDHQLAADPISFKQMVEKINIASELLGSGVKKNQLCEQPFTETIRRKAMTTKPLFSGESVSSSDIVWLRNEQGVSAKEADFITNNKLLIDVPKHSFLMPENFAPVKG
jgi:sialic acid synthase SpsE